MSGILVAPAEAAKPIRCGTINVNFFVYGGYGSFNFNHQLVSDGSQASFTWTCGQTFPISVNSINSGWKFGQWFSSSGAFTSPKSSSTTFSPGGNGVVNIEMVLNRTTNSDWGGFVFQRRSGASGTITEASAVINLPTSVAMRPGDDTEEILSAYVQLGGVNAGDNPWLGGVQLIECGNHPYDLTCPGTPGFYLFWLYQAGGGQVTRAFDCCTDHAFFLGDQIAIDIHYSTANNTGWLSMSDWTHSAYRFNLVCVAPNCFGSYLPTMDSADFVTNAGVISSNLQNMILPSFDGIRFSGIGVTVVSSGVTYFYGASNDMAQWWHQQTVGGLTQALYPSILSTTGYSQGFTVPGPLVGYPGIPCICGGIYSIIAPPDVQIAVGPYHVVEMVNLRVRMWDRGGHQVYDTDLGSFFQTLFDSISDPKVLYDSQSGRWFATLLDISASSVILKVSQSADPTGGWWRYTDPASFNGVNYLPDQPILGVSDDKVAISTNDFNSACTNQYCGVQLWIASKSALTSGSSGTPYVSPPTANPSWYSVHPVQTFAASFYPSTTTLYMVMAQATSVTLFTVTGTPPALSIATQALTIPGAFVAPDAPQRGSTNTLDTGDNRVVDAFWQLNNLWLAIGDACTPAGDTVQRSCVRLVEIYTPSSYVEQSFDTGVTGRYLMYPALRPDPQGNLYVVFGYSSANDFPGVMTSYLAYGQPANTPLQTPTIRVVGSGPETTACNANGVCRYGDYFGAAMDPNDSTMAWVAAEYGTSSYWGTYILQY